LETKLHLESDDQRLELFGPNDAHLRLVRDRLLVKISARESTIVINGEPNAVRTAADVFDHMQKRLIKRGKLNPRDVEELLTQAVHLGRSDRADVIEVYSGKGIIEPFTKGQLEYLKTMLKNDLTFCTGPAGTGKTYLAVAVAVSMLKKKMIRKIVLGAAGGRGGRTAGISAGGFAGQGQPLSETAV
jgi:phosphate starvation-inducible PhoH-like protein